MMLAASSYLWDYIRKTGGGGCFLALSGGADSGLTALIISFMSERLFNYYKEGVKDVTAQLRKVIGNENFDPKSPKEITNRLFSTCYMGTVNSSPETRKRASKLAEFIGSHHMDIDIDSIVKDFDEIIKKLFGFVMKF